MKRWLSFAVLSFLFASQSFDATAEECTLKLLSTIDLPASDHSVFIPVKIGEASKLMLLDTGTPRSMILRSAAKARDLSIVPSNVVMRNVAGEESKSEVVVPLFVFGRFAMERLDLPLFPGNAESLRGDPNVIGIMGADILYNFDLDFDFAANKLNLFSPDHCKGAGVHWQHDAVAAISMRLYNGHINFPMRLNGKNMNAILDTGATASVLMMPVASRVFDIDEETPGIEKEPDSDVLRYRSDELSFEGVIVKNPMVYLIPDKLSGSDNYTPSTGSHIRAEENLPIDLILGMSVLKQLRIYLAYKERRIYITPAKYSGGAAPATATTTPN